LKNILINKLTKKNLNCLNGIKGGIIFLKYIWKIYFTMNLLQYLKSKEFLRTIITIGVIVLILIFGLMKWLNYHTKHDEKIIVPNLEQLSLSETGMALQKINLTFVVIDSAIFNPKFPPKTVIEQNPAGGDFVKENRKIYLTLNPSGYRKITIPNVIDQTKRQVVVQLKSIGFRIGKERYIPDLGKDVVRGLEINNKEINPGDKLPKNTSIDLVLGDGFEKRDSL